MESQSETARRPAQLRLRPVHDIIILREVIAVNPFQNESGWTEVSEALSRDDRMPANITPRCAKDRTLRILDYYKNEDNAALRRSGTEEEYGERERLPGEVLAMSEDPSLTAEPQPSSSAAVQRECLVQQGKKVRSAALQSMQRHSRPVDVADEAGTSTPGTVDDESDEDADELPTPAKRVKVAASSLRASVYQYLVEANKRANEELAVRRMKAENERKRLELEERRLNDERERRQQEREERRQLLQLVHRVLANMQK